MVFGEPCVTIVVPVCDRVPAGRSAFPGHAVTWSIQVEWLLAACGIHGFCKSPKQVCMHIVAWPLSSFRDDPFCLNVFMILVDFNMLINWQSIVIRRLRKYSLKNNVKLLTFFPLGMWFFDAQNTFHFTVRGLKNAFFMPFSWLPIKIMYFAGSSYWSLKLTHLSCQYITYWISGIKWVSEYILS